MLAGRKNSTAAVLFHTAVADRLGLRATDAKTMEILGRLGPMTAGELATHTHLAAASVTSLIDRLEKKRFVRRVRDKNDGRRVIVELTPHAMTRVAPFYDGYGDAYATALADYTDEQLALIIDFLNRATEVASRATAKLAAKST